MNTYPKIKRNLITAALLLALGVMFVASFNALMDTTTTKKIRPHTTAPSNPESMGGAIGVLPEGDTSLAMTEKQADDITGLMRKLQANPNDTKILTQLGDLFMTAGEWGRAESFLTRAIFSNPSATQPRHMLGVCLFQQSKFEEAAKAFEGLLVIEESPAFMFNLAVIYKYNLQKEEEAKKLFEKIIASPDADTDVIAKAKEELAAS